MDTMELANIPRRITLEHGYGEELIGFPLNLLYAALVPPLPASVTQELLARMVAFDPEQLLAEENLRRCVRAVSYRPDPATFIEDADTKQMMYYPTWPSQFSVCVVFDKKLNRWRTFKYRGDKLIRQAFGPTFRNAMLHTTFGGPESDECEQG
jgi:hypothetical protein